MKKVICEAEKNGFCMGCDELVIENIENNYFPYYEKQKKCKTLEKYREI